MSDCYRLNESLYLLMDIIHLINYLKPCQEMAKERDIKAMTEYLEENIAVLANYCKIISSFENILLKESLSWANTFTLYHLRKSKLSIALPMTRPLTIKFKIAIGGNLTF